MKKDLINLLKELVKINSIFPNEKKLGDFIYKLFKSKNFIVKKQLVEKNRYNILVEKGKSDKSILLYSHLDTVDIALNRKTNPFLLKIKNDKAYGLGAWDMKSGIAVNILTSLNYLPKKYKLKLAFCVDEENISKGAFKLINSDFFKDVDLIISTEPSFYYGNQGIVIGRPGRTVFTIKITCQPKHYGFYEKKYDINIFTSNLIEELSKFYKKNSNKKQFVFVKKIHSKTIGLSTPYEINLEIDSSIIPPLNNIKLKKNIERTANIINKKFNNFFNIKIDFFPRETPYLNGYEINRNNKYLKILKKSIFYITKEKPIPYFRSSIADENVFGSTKKTVLGIGPIGGNAHAPNEWVSLSSMKILYNIIINFLDKIDHYDLG